MIQIGDRVLYGIHGVCTVIDTQIQVVNRKKMEYYVLSPLDQHSARFYVPTQNDAAVSKLRPVLSKQELEALLASEETHADRWIEDENQRKQCYRELICSADRTALIGMVRSLYKQKKKQLASGRKFHLCDENFMRDAQKILATEFTAVLGLTQTETMQYLNNMLCE